MFELINHFWGLVKIQRIVATEMINVVSFVHRIALETSSTHRITTPFDQSVDRIMEALDQSTDQMAVTAPVLSTRPTDAAHIPHTDADDVDMDGRTNGNGNGNGYGNGKKRGLSEEGQAEGEADGKVGN